MTVVIVFLGYYYHRLHTAFVRHFGSPFTLAVSLHRHGYIVFCGLIALHGFAGLVDVSWSFCMASGAFFSSSIRLLLAPLFSFPRSPVHHPSYIIGGYPSFFRKKVVYPFLVAARDSPDSPFLSFLQYFVLSLHFLGWNGTHSWYCETSRVLETQK
jgi:hypothetical protein